MCSNFDVYGHLDYIVRYAPNKNFVYDPACFQEEIDALLKAIINAGKGIEVNTAGLKYGLPFAHPKEEILKRYFELGGTYFTVGSDAHKLEHLAYDFQKEAAIFDNLNLSSYYRVFEKRGIKEKMSAYMPECLYARAGENNATFQNLRL